MTPAALLLSSLSLLLAAAHLLRHFGPLAWLILAGFVLLVVRKPVARLSLQIVLTLVTLEWARTLVALTVTRINRGEPWLRMVLILGVVTVISGLAAGLLSTRPLRRYFHADGDADARAAANLDTRVADAADS